MTDRQTRFVQEYLVDGCGTQSAIRCGIAPSGAHVWASRTLRITKVVEALQARQAADATRLSIQREDVLAGLLAAVNTARLQQDPMAMISGLREVGKMLGFYDVQTKRVELAVEGEGALADLGRLSDNELISIMAMGQPVVQ